MTDIPPTPAPRRATRWIPVTLIALVTLVAAGRLLWGVNRYAVNILFWDQWDFWSPMFNNQGYLDLFWYTHAHRQGLGFVLTGALAHLTGWNTRTECFMIAGVLIAALLAALALRRAIFGRWEWTDIIWPVLFFSPLMLDALVQVPNLSHGIMPLLLLMLFCLCWGIKRRWLAYGLMLIVNFNCTFTGFGLFLGLVTPTMFLVEIVAYARGRNYRAMYLAMGALLGSIVSMLIFLHGYVPSAAIPGFQFPDPHWKLYPEFVALQLAYLDGVHGVGRLANIAGWSSVAIALGALVIHGRRLLRPRPPGLEPPAGLFLSQVIVTLMGFGLIFTCFCAVGRMIMGVAGGQTARYLPLLMGMLLAVYFHVASLPRGMVRGALMLWMVVTLIGLHGWQRPEDRQNLEIYATGKQLWKQAYLATGSIEEAERASNFQVYPRPVEHTLQWRLDELRRRHLNLFLDAPPSPAATAASAPERP